VGRDVGAHHRHAQPLRLEHIQVERLVARGADHHVGGVAHHRARVGAVAEEVHPRGHVEAGGEHAQRVGLGAVPAHEQVHVGAVAPRRGHALDREVVRLAGDQRAHRRHHGRGRRDPERGAQPAGVARLDALGVHGVEHHAYPARRHPVGQQPVDDVLGHAHGDRRLVQQAVEPPDALAHRVVQVHDQRQPERPRHRHQGGHHLGRVGVHEVGPHPLEEGADARPVGRRRHQRPRPLVRPHHLGPERRRGGAHRGGVADDHRPVAVARQPLGEVEQALLAAPNPVRPVVHERDGRRARRSGRHAWAAARATSGSASRNVGCL
jgi:hypothetical protein